MLLQRFYHTGLAQASYLIGCQATGEAAVIDPNRDTDQYLAAAQRAGLRIVAVTETHIHADYVSGARELARRAGALLYLSAMGPAEWQYAFAATDGAKLLRDGDVIKLGNVRIEAAHTPGHTPEHVSFLVTDGAAADEPMGICSGDFVFVGDVGRPDLLERAAGFAGTMEAGARQLFSSLRRFRDLPDYVQVWPGHGAGSACGKALGAVPQSTVGYEKRHGWAFRLGEEQAFVDAVLSGQPDPPPYFAQMKRINRDGAEARPTGALAELPFTALLPAHSDGPVVVDVRSADAFAAEHIPGTINIPLDGDFLTWAGWLLPYNRPIALIGSSALARQARDELTFIGLDNVSGYWNAETVFAQWRQSGHSMATLTRQGAVDLQSAILHEDALVVDVRSVAEFVEGHAPGALNIPLGRLVARRNELPEDRLVVVMCQSGGRSPIAASVLESRGWSNLIEMRDGFDGWKAAGGPVAR